MSQRENEIILSGLQNCVNGFLGDTDIVTFSPAFPTDELQVFSASYPAGRMFAGMSQRDMSWETFSETGGCCS